jgi:hypothetical protein
LQLIDLAIAAGATARAGYPCAARPPAHNFNVDPGEIPMSFRTLALSILFFTAGVLHAADLEPLHRHCTIGLNRQATDFSVYLDSGDCPHQRHCGSNFSNESFGRFTGITLADLGQEGAQLTATLSAEAGTFTCSGTVHDHELEGDGVFTPDPAFVDRMQKMGFSETEAEKLLAYAFVGVDSAWVRSMQQTGIRGLNVDNLIALRIFKADPAYIQSIVALGYEMPDADQLIALKVQGVDVAEVREIRSMGYQPTLDELIQIRIFKITPDFIRRMQARGFNHLTIGKLVQIRIFNLAE